MSKKMSLNEAQDNQTEVLISDSAEEASEAVAEEKRILKRKKLRRIFSVIVLLFFVAIIVYAVIYIVRRSKGEDVQTDNFITENYDSFEVVQMVTATGTTTMGYSTELFDPDYITTELTIDDVYVSTGDTIEEGTKLLSLTEDSVAEARTELEDALKSAELAYRSGKIEYEQSLITAQYTCDSSILNGNQAEKIYQETMNGLQEAIDSLKTQLDKANELLAEYQASADNDAYRDYYQVDELFAQYTTDYNTLIELQDKYNVNDTELTASLSTIDTTNGTSQAGGTQGSGQMSSGSSSSSGSTHSTHYYEVLVVQEWYAHCTQELADYNTALADYENAVKEASRQLTAQQLAVSTLQAQLAQAQTAYNEGCISAKAAYDASLTDSSNASEVYDTAVKKAAATLETLKDAYTDAQEHLEEFEAVIGDGYLYSSGAGDVVMVNVRTDMNLLTSPTVLGYSDISSIAVAVSVDQTDISQISVGDQVNATISGYGMYTGTVTEINPVSSSDSKSSVYYDVTIILDGDTTALTSNLEASIVFQTGGTN